MNLKKFIIITIFIMLTAAGGLWADTFSVGSADFSEGFEVNEHSWNSYESVLEIVSSGTDGITSSGGDYHLKITDPATGDPGSYTWLGGTDYGFNLGWSSSIDIYINLSDSKIQSGEYGFHLSQSISDTDGSPYLQDNIWHVGAVDDGEGGYEVGVNTGHGTNGTPSNSVINPGNYHNVDYGVFNQSGWYTFHVAFTNGVEITWTISDENDNEVWTASEITENYQASEAGGNGYLWFTTIEADAMNIDNVEVVRETYDTIQAAIDDATSGDIIDVAAGDYDVATTINVNKSVTIDGTDSGTATVTAIDDAAIPIFEITVDNVTIKDLDITTTQATIDAYDSYDGLIQTPASGYTLTGLVIENNNIWSPLQGDQSTMGTWNARGIYIGRNTTATVEDNTVYNLRTGMVARYGCSVTYTNNLVYNTKGGIMNYTNSLDDDDDYTITGNSWTAPDPQYSHNQWDIVWNSGGSYSDPLPAGHYEHVVTNSENNNGAYVIDQRGPGTTKAVYGNRSHVFVEAGSGYNTAEDNVGNFLEPYATIDLGIGAVATGGIVNVAAGTYTEQLHITTEDLTIQGTATSDVIVKSPEDLTEFYNSGSNDNYPVVFVDGGDGCTLKNLTVDGDNQGDNNYRFQGIGYWNAGGTMQNLNVINVMNSTFSGAQHGVGVYCYNNDSGPYNLTVDNVDVTDFQKNAFALNGDNLTVTMSNCDVVGAGATDVTAQNGIQIWGNGSTGTITDCTVDGINYTPGDWTASAFLNYYAEVTLTNVTISNSETSFYNYYGSNINFNNCSTSNSVSTSFYNYGCDNIIYDNCSTTNPAGDAFYAWAVGSSKSSSIKEELSVPFGEGNNVKDKASDDITVEMDNCTFTGTGAADSWGIGLIADDNTTLDATIENCDISDWDTAIYTYGNEDPTQCTINSASHENDLSGNNYGFQNNTDITQDATCNYWGSPLGPDDPDNSPALNPFYTNPGDCGNAVSANVDFMPWYATETTSPATAKATLKSDVGSKAIIEVFTSDSLTSALENCTATDTIVLGSGTFTGDFEVGAGITMQAADGTTPVINGTLTIDSDDVSIDGVTLDASGTGSQAVVVSTGVDASTIEIQNGVILGDGASGKVAVLNNGTNDIGNLDGNWWGSSSPDFNDLIEPDPGSNPTPSSVAPISIYVSAPSEIISDDSTQTYSVIANDVEDLYTFAVQIKFLKEDFDAPVWPTDFDLGGDFSGNIFFNCVSDNDATYYMYTVTGGFLGTEPGITGTDVTLFTVNITSSTDASAPSGTLVSLPVSEVVLKSPENDTITCDGTTGKVIYIDSTEPLPITWGVDDYCRPTPEDNNSIDLKWTNPDSDVEYIHILYYDYADLTGASVYPEFDPATSPLDTWPDATGWTKITDTVTGNSYTWDCSSQGRGYYYFALFVEDAAGNMSTHPASYGQSISYWPGDVNATPDGNVNSDDINLLSAVWGLEDGDGNWNNDIDVGPTTDYGRHSRPTPDDVIDIEDLMIFAMNYLNTDYSVYSKEDIPDPHPIQIDLVTSANGDQIIAELMLDGNDGFVKGLHIPVNYGNGLVVNSINTGNIWQNNDLFLNTDKDNCVEVDGSALGALGIIENNGTIATITFDIVGDDTELEITEPLARSVDNEEIECTGYNYEVEEETIPTVYKLYQNYPNPFNNETNIKFALPQTGPVTISVYNVKGQLVERLIDDNLEAGNHVINWHNPDLKSGMYFYKIETEKYNKIKKCLLIR